MLTVHYAIKIGHYTMTQKHGDKIRKYRIDICYANCLCAMVRFYEENGEKIAELNGFFTDIPHAKRCLKDKILGNCDNFVFNVKQCNSDIWKLIRLLAENGKKVTIK